MQRLYIIVLILAGTACSNKSTPNDFDASCDVFTEFQESKKPLTVTTLLDALKARVGEKSDAYISWQALVYMDAPQRYETFKYTTEDVLSIKNWECPAMKNLAHTLTIDFD